MSVYDPSYVKRICRNMPNGVPKIIHQIWINESNIDFPEHWKISPIKWKEYHPDYIYILWEAETALQFIRQYFPDYVEIYQRFKYVVNRCDFLKYCLMYSYGGIYSDLDNYCIANIEQELLKYQGDIFFPEIQIFYTIVSPNNNLIFSKPNLDVPIHLINHMRDHIDDVFYNKTFLIKCLSGVDYIKQMVRSKTYNICILPYQKFNPYSITDDLTKPRPDAIILATKGGTWYDETMNAYLFMLKYWWIALIFVVIIFFLVIFCSSYFPTQNKKNIKSSSKQQQFWRKIPVKN